MGLRDGIALGLSLSNAYNQDLKQRADNAYQDELRQRQRGLWQATNQAGEQSLLQIEQARKSNTMPVSEAGIFASPRDPRVLRQGGYADEQSTAPQEQMALGDAYDQALGVLEQKAKLAQASGDANALLGVQDELRKLRMSTGAAAVRNRVAMANDAEFASLANAISDDKRNRWQMTVDPKTGMTTVSNGGESVQMNRDQLADLVAARWRLKQGDPTAAQEIAKINKSFADEGDGQLNTFANVARINNDAAYRGGMLNAAQVRAAGQQRAGATAGRGAAVEEDDSEPDFLEGFDGKAHQSAIFKAISDEQATLPAEQRMNDAQIAKAVVGRLNALKSEYAQANEKEFRVRTAVGVLNKYRNDPQKYATAYQQAIDSGMTESVLKGQGFEAPAKPKAPVSAAVAAQPATVPQKPSLKVISEAGIEKSIFGRDKARYNIQMPDGTTKMMTADELEKLGMPTEWIGGIKRYSPNYK